LNCYYYYSFSTDLSLTYRCFEMGYDRRFWIFESCPGFFVENDDEFVGSCLPQPTPCTPLGPTPDSSKSKEDIRKFFKTANKENQDAVDK